MTSKPVRVSWAVALFFVSLVGAANPSAAADDPKQLLEQASQALSGKAGAVDVRRGMMLLVDAVAASKPIPYSVNGTVNNEWIDIEEAMSVFPMSLMLADGGTDKLPVELLARMNLGMIHLSKTEGARYAELVKEAQSRAEKGAPSDQFTLGLLLASQYPKRDSSGNLQPLGPYASDNLARYFGDGVAAAEPWLTKAGDQQHAKAKELARRFGAIKLLVSYHQRAMAGDTGAQAQMAQMMTSKHPDDAYRWYGMALRRAPADKVAAWTAAKDRIAKKLYPKQIEMAEDWLKQH